MVSKFYSHFLHEEDRDQVSKEFQRVIVNDSKAAGKAIDHALLTFRLAKELGIQSPRLEKTDSLPYSVSSDNVTFNAPLISLVVGRKMRFLRGWKQFEGCIKGSNGLGLLASQVAREEKKIGALSSTQLLDLKREYLASRLNNATPVFSEETLASLTDMQLHEVSDFHLAIWKAFATKTIVCSTSSNMGISLHEALRFLQQKTLILKGHRFNLLNLNEGKLIIWCPDENADFMNPEKTAKLRAIERELPKLTYLRTYINRKQRDPGALRDAFECGGYFFPTNPQSKEELQNLVTLSLDDMSKSKGVSAAKILQDKLVGETLESLGARISGEQVVIQEHVDGGLLGLSLNYLLVLEECLLHGDSKAMSVWNQASIGAALAALVIADQELRNPSSKRHSELHTFFPKLAGFLRTQELGKTFPTRIHGVFDSSNLQSLAQLFGVVFDKHLTGRGTAFVGLGSSSYANGNLCYDILKESSESNGAFKGRDHLHPATHTLNPIAQALIYAEDLYRVTSSAEFNRLAEAEQIEMAITHVRKPEPAGAAALAGYLLSRLDTGSLTYNEMTFALKLGGFDRESFLDFCGYTKEEAVSGSFVQSAYEEGEYMGLLAENILAALDCPLKDLSEKAKNERLHSRVQYSWAALDDQPFEALNPSIYICLTGDNCAQPSAELVKVLLENSLSVHEETNRILAADAKLQEKPEAHALTLAVMNFQIALQKMMDKVLKLQKQMIESLLKPIANHYKLKALASTASAYVAQPSSIQNESTSKLSKAQIQDTIKQLVPDETRPVLLYASVFPFYRIMTTQKNSLASTLLETILEALGPNRTVIMHTDTSGYKEGILDLDKTPATNGMLNELFRQLPQAKRTSSAFFSFAAIGKDRDTLCALSPKEAWGSQSVFEWLEKENAYLLMLGVPWKMCDFIHRAEWLAGVPYRYAKQFEGEIVNQGIKKTMREELFVRCLNPRVEVDWGNLDAHFKNFGMAQIQVGKAQFSSMKAQDLLTAMLSVLKKNPYAYVKDQETITRYFSTLQKDLPGQA